MGGSKVIQVANTQVGERRDEAICVILCIEYALEGRGINTTNNMLYLLRYLHVCFMSTAAMFTIPIIYP